MSWGTVYQQKIFPKKSSEILLEWNISSWMWKEKSWDTVKMKMFSTMISFSGKLFQKACRLHIHPGKFTSWCSSLRDPSLQNSCVPSLEDLPKFEGMKINSSWWLNQPISKICSSNWKSSPRGENNKMFQITTLEKDHKLPFPKLWKDAKKWYEKIETNCHGPNRPPQGPNRSL